MNSVSYSPKYSQSKAKDEEFLIRLVTNTLPSIHSRRAYSQAIRCFMQYWCEEGYPLLTKGFLNQYVMEMQDDQGKGEATINKHLAAIRKLASEAADNEIWPEKVSISFSRVKGIPLRGRKKHNWLTQDLAQKLLNSPDTTTAKGLRDRAMLAVMIGCGLRRAEAFSLTVEHIQLVQGRWAIVNILGKRNKIRTVPMPGWVKQTLDQWLEVSGIFTGIILRGMVRGGHVRKTPLSYTSGWETVRYYGEQIGIDNLAPHDLRRTFAKLAHTNGAPIEQIRLSLGHASLSTTEIYLGIDQDFHNAPGDFIDFDLE